MDIIPLVKQDANHHINMLIPKSNTLWIIGLRYDDLHDLDGFLVLHYSQITNRQAIINSTYYDLYVAGHLCSVCRVDPQRSAARESDGVPLPHRLRRQQYQF